MNLNAAHVLKKWRGGDPLWRSSFRLMVTPKDSVIRRGMFHDSTMSSSTIFSLSSGLSNIRSAVAVVRISGRGASDVRCDLINTILSINISILSYNCLILFLFIYNNYHDDLVYCLKRSSGSKDNDWHRST